MCCNFAAYHAVKYSRGKTFAMLAMFYKKAIKRLLSPKRDTNVGGVCFIGRY